MTASRFLPALLLALAAPAAADPGAGGPKSVRVTQLTIRERVIVRVPRMPVGPVRAALPPVTWKEKGGPKCVAVADLAGALVTQPDAVDLVLVGGKRLRAKLDGECRPLDFYSGFYLKPSSDGKVCADRDAIRARSGATCPISRFRTLKPQPAKR
jgi:hypothetical protein